jgi:PAS domain S-box-containing protein
MVEVPLARDRVSTGAMPTEALPVDLGTVLEGMSDAFYALDRNWSFAYVNGNAERIWQRLRDELLGRDIRLVFPELVGSDVATAVAAALTEGKNAQFETTDPAVGMPVELRIVANHSGVAVYFRDITARRQMARAFRGHDEILAMAEASAGIGVWDLDLRTGMLQGTAQFFRIMGLEPTTGSVPIETTRRLRHPGDRERVAQNIDHAVAHGEDYLESEYRIVRPDGAMRWIFGRGRVIRDATGVPVRCNGVDVDITDRKLAEAALRESEARFRRVFEQSPLGKAMAGLDFHFRAVNPALCGMLGYTEDELTGRNFLDIVHPDDRENCSAMAEALVNGTLQQIQLEERFVRKSGEALWARVNVGPIRDADGNILYTLGIIENIDERKRITQALLDSELRPTARWPDKPGRSMSCSCWYQGKPTLAIASSSRRHATSPTASNSRRNFARRRKWKPSASSPAASHMISITCLRSSVAMRNWPDDVLPQT